MPATFVAQNSTYTNTGAQTLTCPLPAGCVDGDLLIVTYVVATSNTINTTPAGWTVFVVDNQIDTGVARMAIAWTRFTTGMATPTFGLSATTTAKSQVFCTAYRDAADPVFSTPAEVTATSQTYTYTTTVANTRVVSILVQRVSSQTGWTKPASVTQRYFFENGGGGSVGGFAGDELHATAGAQTRTATWDSNANAYAVAALLAPASVTPPTTANTQAAAAIVTATSSAGSGGTVAYSIAQTSGTTTAPLLISTGKWAIPRHATSTLVYTITATESPSGLTATSTATVTPTPAGGGDQVLVRNAARTAWV